MDLLVTLLPVLLLGGPFFLWIAMLVHVVKHDIPNKILWILILIITNIVGGPIYYFAVYRKREKNNGLMKRTFVFGAAALVVIASIAIFTLPPKSAHKVEEIPINKVVDYGINKKIKRIEVRGDELLITKKGETSPSLRSKKPAGTSIHDHGINLEDVEISIVD